MFFFVVLKHLFPLDFDSDLEQPFFSFFPIMFLPLVAKSVFKLSFLFVTSFYFSSLTLGLP